MCARACVRACVHARVHTCAEGKPNQAHPKERDWKKSARSAKLHDQILVLRILGIVAALVHAIGQDRALAFLLAQVNLYFCVVLLSCVSWFLVSVQKLALLLRLLLSDLHLLFSFLSLVKAKPFVGGYAIHQILCLNCHKNPGVRIRMRSCEQRASEGADRVFRPLETGQRVYHVYWPAQRKVDRLIKFCDSAAQTCECTISLLPLRNSTKSRGKLQKRCQKPNSDEQEDRSSSLKQ